MNFADYFMQVLPMLMAAAAVWGGIRADLKNIMGRIKRVEERADSAHSRIDGLHFHQRSTDA